MQFLRLIFVKKLPLQGASPPLDPPRGAFCGSQSPTFQLTFPFLISMPDDDDNIRMMMGILVMMMEPTAGRMMKNMLLLLLMMMMMMMNKEG